ncbi:SusC/RagA family TonB-linked outer membrane protein [Segatella asaccharophila]
MSKENISCNRFKRILSYRSITHFFRFLLLFLFFIPLTSNAQNQNFAGVNVVQGKVLDSTNKDPLIGVTIIVKGTDFSAVTDVDGNFSVKVPYVNATLIFSYIGYQSQSVELKGRKSLVVLLEEDTKALSEVVVTGYRTQKREDITGAVSTITTKDLVQSPTANINNALAGRLPGMIVNQYAGGEPGVDKAEIFIRGKSTYNDQSPIVIVDGVERDMSYISPDEIESLTILKDAASTAPYGIRGANGVIVITTKRGTASGRASVNFKASAGVNYPVQLPNLLGSADYATLYNEAMINDAKRTGADVSSLKLFSDQSIENFRKAKGDNSDGLGYNWNYFDYIYKPAMQTDYSLSVRGGSDKAKYFVLAGYMNQGSNFDHTNLSQYNTSAKFEKYNFRSNIDVDITKNFWLKLDLGALLYNRVNIGSSASLLSTLAFTQPPYLPITLEENDNAANKAYYQSNPNGLLYGDQIYRYNVLGELSRTGYHNQKQTEVTGNFSLGYNLDFITKGLKIEGTFSYDSREGHWIYRTLGTYSEGYRVYPQYATFVPKDVGRDVYMEGGHYMGAYTTGNKYSADQTIGSSLNKDDPYNHTYYQLKLTYDRTFSNVHNVSGMLLLNRSTESVSGGEDVDHRYQGMTGQFAYNYASKYFGEFNFGYNGSENFAKGHRYGFFPAGSIGWIISKEKFMQKTSSWLDLLKIRASLGWVGSDKLPSGRFAYLAYYGSGDSYNFGDQNFNTNVGGWGEQTFGNPNLTWEKAKKTNIGIDLSVLKHKLELSIDLFQENRYHIITSLSGDDKLGFPSMVGRDAPYVNSGRVKNHGIDFELTIRGNVGRDFNWMVRPNFTYAKNKVIYENEIPREYEWRQETGHELYLNYLYVFDHFVKDQAEADKLNAEKYQPWGILIPGDVVYKDLNGDGKITDLGDRKRMGYPRSPEIQFGLPVTLEYKNFDLSFLFQGAAHTSMELTDAAVWDFPSYDQDKIGSVRPLHLKRWTSETVNTAKYPALSIGANSNNKNSSSSLFLYNARYIRLKNVELGYSMPNEIIRRIGLSRVRFYAQGQNLATYAPGLKDVDVDPELGSSNGYQYPILRILNFGVDITF